MLSNLHVQTTAQIWPNNQQLKELISLPLVLSLQPFANEHPQSAILPQNINQYRCQSCKAFLNQLCFIRSDNQYDCSICGCTNYMPQPIDISIPQLNNMSYRLKAPQKQRLLTTKERLFIFVLDLSLYGFESKEYLLYSVHLIRQFVKNLQQQSKTVNIMLVGFDSAVHRFVMNPNQPPGRYVFHGHYQNGDEVYLPQMNDLIGNISSTKNIEIILDELIADITNGDLKPCNSEGFLQALKLSLKASEGYSGKIFLISGINDQVAEFKHIMSRYYYDVSKKHGFQTNKTECLKGELQSILQSTQMSLCFFFINNNFMNNMPFHVMAKLTNGQLRHYFPNQNLLFYHNFRQILQQIINEDTAYQSLMRVRYSTGIKLIGTFGNYRTTKICDQIQLLTCPTHRKYLFEFIVQGKITSEFVVVQFSSLYTDIKGDRFFIIQTRMNKVNADINAVIESINYINVNSSYVRGVTHNLDSSGTIRSLQLALQERCRRHIVTLKHLQDSDSQNSQLLKKAKPYLIQTFLLMKHFLLNQNYQNVFFYDLNAELRSKIATLQDSINIVWPMVYAVREDGWQIIEMQYQNIPKATVAIFIDRCDQHYCYLANPKLQASMRGAGSKQLLSDLIDTDESLVQLKRLVEQVKTTKQTPYIDILPLEDLKQLSILDMQGQYGFDKFINVLIEGIIK